MRRVGGRRRGCPFSVANSSAWSCDRSAAQRPSCHLAATGSRSQASRTSSGVVRVIPDAVRPVTRASQFGLRRKIRDLSVRSGVSTTSDVDGFKSLWRSRPPGPAAFIATWSLSEAPLDLRAAILSELTSCDALLLLLAYGDYFAGVDNRAGAGDPARSGFAQAGVDGVDDFLDAVAEGVLGQGAASAVGADGARFVGVDQVVIELSA